MKINHNFLKILYFSFKQKLLYLGAALIPTLAAGYFYMVYPVIESTNNLTEQHRKLSATLAQRIRMKNEIKRVSIQLPHANHITNPTTAIMEEFRQHNIVLERMQPIDTTNNHLLTMNIEFKVNYYQLLQVLNMPKNINYPIKINNLKIIANRSEINITPQLTVQSTWEIYT